MTTLTIQSGERWRLIAPLSRYDVYDLARAIHTLVPAARESVARLIAGTAISDRAEGGAGVIVAAAREANPEAFMPGTAPEMGDPDYLEAIEIAARVLAEVARREQRRREGRAA